MTQQTDLPPLSPSRGDLLAAWLRPWRFVLPVAGKMAPFAVALWLIWSDPVGWSEATAEASVTLAETTLSLSRAIFGITEGMMSVVTDPGLMILLPLPFLLKAMLEAFE